MIRHLSNRFTFGCFFALLGFVAGSLSTGGNGMVAELSGAESIQVPQPVAGVPTLANPEIDSVELIPAELASDGADACEAKFQQELEGCNGDPECEQWAYINFEYCSAGMRTTELRAN